MDVKLQFDTVALVLLFAAFPITSYGTTNDNTVIWVLGLLCMLVGGLLPIATRFMDHSRDTIRDVGMEFDDRTS